MTPTDEAEDLVDNVVDDARTKIIEKHEDLIQQIVSELDNHRQMNAVTSEVRRRMQ